MKIAIYGRKLKAKSVSFAKQLYKSLKELNIDFKIDERYYNSFQSILPLGDKVETFNTYNDISDVDFVFSLGGDGTLLDTLALVRNSGIPVVGINFGTLGFLAGIAKEDIEPAIKSLINGTYVIEKRSLIQLESNKPLFNNLNFGLNEFTIQRRDTSSMITIHTYINGELLNSYWADGLIVSTPTGSTGYSLSCGGPIIHPDSDNFVITPVGPHNLNVRPIVVSSDVVISFGVEGRENSFLCTLDSRFESIDSSYHLAVGKADFQIRLVRLNDDSFLNAIRQKLMWGMDQRN